MSKPFDLIAGAQIHVEPARHDAAALVTLHKLGSADRLFLTPDEARRLGQALVAASAKASES